MRNDIDNTQDILDVRDIIARFELLESDLNDIKNADDTKADIELAEWIAALPDASDEMVEYKTLAALLDEMKGNGGDEEWRGDWYPVTLIRDSYFEEYMDDMLEDCGDLKPFEQRPCYIKITIDYDALQMDYTSCEYEGVTYWYR